MHPLSRKSNPSRPADSPRGPGKRYIIFPAAFLASTGIGMLVLGIIFFARDVCRASPAQIGCLSATWSLCYVFGCVFLRGVSGRLPPRKSIMGAMWCMSLSTTALSLSHSLPVAFVCYGAFGLCAAFFWPPMMGWLSMGMEGRDLGRAMGIFNICWSLGAILGPTLAGYLSEIDPSRPLTISAAVFCVNAIWITIGSLTLNAVRGEAHHARTAAAFRVGRDGTLLRYPSWAGLFAAYLILGVVNNVFPLSAPDEFGIGKAAVGNLFLVRSVATTAMLAMMGHSVWWHFRGWQLAAGHALFALLMIWMARASSVSIAGMLLFAIGILLAHSYSNSLFHGVAGSRTRAPRMAVHEGLLSAGLVVGSACGGAVFEHWGVRAVYQGCAGVLAIVALAETIFFAVLRRRRLDPRIGA